MVAHGVSAEFPRSSYGVHGVLTAFPPRLYGASMAFSRRVVYLTAFPWRLQGVVTAFMALAWRFYRVLWRSYDKSTEKDEQKDMQILSQKQTNHYLNGMHIHEFFNKFLSICLSSSKLVYYLCVCRCSSFKLLLMLLA